jgi:glycogen debranching enzyme
VTDPFNAGESVAIRGDNGIITVIEGTTFCLSSRDGDITPGGASGLFVDDARVLSRLSVLLDGQRCDHLSTRASSADQAEFVLRRRPGAGAADSTLLVVRVRHVDRGLHETITLENVGREATTATLTVHVDADFADLFTVKNGGPTTGRHVATVATDELTLRSVHDTGRSIRVRATGQPVVSPSALTWRIVIPPRGRWQTTIDFDASTDDTPSAHLAPMDQDAAEALPHGHETVLGVANPGIAAVLDRTIADLDSLRMIDERTGHTYVAAGAPWFMTLFGRDSLLTAWMALPLDVGLAVGTLQTLASLQGTVVDAITEEEPGRILHEQRRGPDSDLALGGQRYYGSVDATPIFVMLLAEAARWGADLDTIRALLPHADAALAWLDEYGDRDGDGFVEYRRATDRGLINQGWKDSFDGVNNAAGQIAVAPVALCEVQGYAYAARQARAYLADLFDDRAAAQHWRDRAATLRDAFAEAYWVPKSRWLAIALDGDKIQMDALTSNLGHCLWTGIVSDEHAAHIVAALASPAMNTGYGLRTLSTDMGAYNPMSYHNGSVWPHDTAIGIAGLMRYRHIPGAVELAHALAAGLFDAATAFGDRLPELFCGFGRDTFAPPVPYPTSCSPQAWASAAPLLVLRAFLGLAPDLPAGRVELVPDLPEAWGAVALEHVHLGAMSATINAKGATGSVERHSG